MLATDPHCETLVWEEARELRRGYMPAGLYNQLCAALLSWSHHTAVNFQPDLGRNYALVAFGRHRVLLTRDGEEQPSVAIQLLSTGEPAPVLERLRRVTRLEPCLRRICASSCNDCRLQASSIAMSYLCVVM